MVSWIFQKGENQPKTRRKITGRSEDQKKYEN
jgi:hypothetical protein